MEKGQFYLISLTFSAIAIIALLAFVLFVEFGPVSARQGIPDEFENLQNSIEQRNEWVKGYWFNMSWHSRTFVNLTTAPVAQPVEINSRIPDTGVSGDCGFARLFNKSLDGRFTEVPLTINSSTPPCSFTLNYKFGSAYELYWNTSNSPSGAPTFGSGTVHTPQVSIVEQRPLEGICRHFASGELLSRNILLGCTGTTLENSYNYSITYSGSDFEYKGSTI
jgi:hypothetical protein